MTSVNKKNVPWQTFFFLEENEFAMETYGWIMICLAYSCLLGKFTTFYPRPLTQVISQEFITANCSFLEEEDCLPNRVSSGTRPSSLSLISHSPSDSVLPVDTVVEDSGGVVSVVLEEDSTLGGAGVAALGGESGGGVGDGDGSRGSGLQRGRGRNQYSYCQYNCNHHLCGYLQFRFDVHYSKQHFGLDIHVSHSSSAC